MDRLHSSVEVSAPVDLCFEQWSRFEQLPSCLNSILNVTDRGNGRYHWTIRGPLGSTVEWEADLLNKIDNEFISFRSVPGTAILLEGAIRFESLTPNSTRITAAIEYEAPGGDLGEAIAKHITHVDQMLKDELIAFKNCVELKTNLTHPVLAG